MCWQDCGHFRRFQGRIHFSLIQVVDGVLFLAALSLRVWLLCWLHLGMLLSLLGSWPFPPPSSRSPKQAVIFCCFQPLHLLSSVSARPAPTTVGKCSGLQRVCVTRWGSLLPCAALSCPVLTAQSEVSITLATSTRWTISVDPLDCQHLYLNSDSPTTFVFS